MTVAELIELLNKMPQDAKVVVRGYENGADDVAYVDECSLIANSPGLWFEGTYFLSENGPVNAVRIVENAKDAQPDSRWKDNFSCHKFLRKPK